MEAAKRMFDNSYNQRLETAALAKAYLDNSVSEVTNDNDEVMIKKRANTGRVCSVIGIFSSLVYCLMIFGLLLAPLVMETRIQRKHIENRDLNSTITNLQDEKDELEIESKRRESLINITEIAIEELGFITRDESLSRTIKVHKEISLEEARNAFFDKTIDYTSNVTLD